MQSLRSSITPLALAAALAACSDSAATPDGAVLASVGALRQNDLAAFLRGTTSAEDYRQMERDWEEKRREERSPAEDTKFEEMMSKLTAPNAAEDLFAEIQPQLAEAQAEWKMMTGMLPMLVGQAASQTEVGAQDVQQVTGALAAKLGAIDITDEAKVKRVLEIATGCARKLDLATMDDLAALDLDAALGRGGVLMGGVKQVLAVYDISIDDMLDSTQATVVSESEGTASVSVTYDMFGTSQTTTVEMANVDGRWVPKK